MEIGTSTVTAIYLGTTSIVSAYLGSTQVFGGASAFTPLSLFSGGSQGIWLDPSDLSTMFSDRAGTTPVTTPGTVVGLRLDKSKGLALGAELVANGDFSDGTTNWAAASGGSVENVGGKGVVTTPDGDAIGGCRQTITVEAGKTYLLSWDIDAFSGTAWQVDAPPYASGARTDLGSKSAYITPTTSSVLVTISARSSGAGAQTATFDNISVRELPGNHAVAPTDAARPVYGVEPKGGRRNILTYSEDLTNAAWSNAGVTVSGQNIVETFATGQHIVWQSSVALASATVFVDAKANGRNWLRIAVRSAGSSKAAYFNLATGVVGSVAGGITSNIIGPDAGGFYRCFVYGPTDVNTSGIQIGPTTGDLVGSHTGDGTSGVTVARVQYETGSTATAYQRVLSAYDVTESGVATTHYVQYDGANSSSTAAIDFSGTDKMSIFAGVWKRTDTAQGVFVELSATIASNNGSFLLAAPDGATATFGFDSKGTAQVDAVASGLTAPISRIITGLADIAGDTATIRIDGVQADQDTGDQGTGNYGNYAMFIGRRNNTANPFNGRDFGLIIVGKAASSTEITDTETWLAAKTAQVTL